MNEGKIIKGTGAVNLPIFSGNLLKYQVLLAEEKAQAVLNEAHQRAANLVTDAESEVEQIHRQAYQSGRDEAEEELVESILTIREKRQHLLQESERDILALSVKIAEKIIGKEIELNETTRAEVILNALRHSRQQEELTVRINTGDMAFIEQLRERMDSSGRARFVNFVADQAVKSGGCIIESPSGIIDARIETQLRILEKTLISQILEKND